MKRIYFYFLFIFLSSCKPDSKTDNKHIFESKRYKNEEELAYSQLLEQINFTPSRKPRKLLFFLKIDSLTNLDIDRKDTEYLNGELESRKLDLIQINKFDNLKILFIPNNLTNEKKMELDKIYWNYRKAYQTTNGEFTLTRIAFNQNYTHGLLRYTLTDSRKYTDGCVLHIIKVDGKWLIDKKEVCSPFS